MRVSKLSAVLARSHPARRSSDMVRGKTVEEAEKIEEGDIIKFLGKIPMQKIHCASLAKRTLRKAIAAYEGKPFNV